MRVYQLNHTTWVCDYHVVWCPKYRGKVLADGYIKQELKRMFKHIAQWKRCVIHAWHIGDEHIHLYISISPKYSVAYLVQILKEKEQEVSKRNIVGTRVLCINDREQRASDQIIYPESTAPPERLTALVLVRLRRTNRNHQHSRWWLVILCLLYLPCCC